MNNRTRRDLVTTAALVVAGAAPRQAGASSNQPSRLCEASDMQPRDECPEALHLEQRQRGGRTKVAYRVESFNQKEPHAS
jgi:hypothetical protein